jgi:hypothetical protein
LYLDSRSIQFLQPSFPIHKRQLVSGVMAKKFIISVKLRL